MSPSATRKRRILEFDEEELDEEEECGESPAVLIRQLLKQRPNAKLFPTSFVVVSVKRTPFGSQLWFRST